MEVLGPEHFSSLFVVPRDVLDLDFDHGVAVLCSSTHTEEVESSAAVIRLFPRA